MITINLNNLELNDARGENQPDIHANATFPLAGALGSENSALVYFELAPGDRLGRHTDSVEELLYIIAGTVEVTVGEEKDQISQNQIALVPTMVPHDLRNVGQERAKVLGFFGAAIVYLEPGDYALIDTVPSKDGTPHVNRGMAKAVTVTNTQVGVEPTAELTVDMLDFAYTLSEPLKAGQYNIRVNNQGEQPHEIFLARLQPNKGVEDLLASLAPDAPLEAIDWQALGGISVIEPEAHGYFPVDLAPGKYALLCFAPDHGSGMPHFMKGMAQEFVIE